MKELLIILDGVSEEKIPQLGKSPLEFADARTLRRIRENGRHHKEIFYPKGKTPDSLNCILTVLGVPEEFIPRNRAFLEAEAMGIHIKSNQAVMRCNLVGIKDGRMDSFNGAGLTTDEMRKLSERVHGPGNIRFFHVSHYRNLLVADKTPELMSLKSIPPHEHVGDGMEELLKPIEKTEQLYEFVSQNKSTVRGMKYMFYPWGVSEYSRIPSYESLHGKICSLICAAEIVRGMGKAMDMHVVDLKNATGDVDTDLNEKCLAVLRELEKRDVVICHINGTDEVSHRKDWEGKVEFIEKIDRELLAPIYDKFENTEQGMKITILSDHQTSSVTGSHEKGFVDVFSIESGGNRKWQG